MQIELRKVEEYAERIRTLWIVIRTSRNVTKIRNILKMWNITTCNEFSELRMRLFRKLNSENKEIERCGHLRLCSQV